MAKKKAPASSVPSPCISVCTVEEETGFCRGCKRTLKEIADWDFYSDEDKKEVIAELEKRKGSDSPQY